MPTRGWWIGLLLSAAALRVLLLIATAWHQTEHVSHDPHEHPTCLWCDLADGLHQGDPSAAQMQLVAAEHTTRLDARSPLWDASSTAIRPRARDPPAAT
jgi:hypothetical protein